MDDKNLKPLLQELAEHKFKFMLNIGFVILMFLLLSPMLFFWLHWLLVIKIMGSLFFLFMFCALAWRYCKNISKEIVDKYYKNQQQENNNTGKSRFHQKMEKMMQDAKDKRN